MHTFGGHMRKMDGSRSHKVPIYQHPAIAFTLDKLILLFGFPQPDFIKIDVDGTEFNVLQGARKILHNVSSIIIEVVADTQNDIHGFLTAAGFELQKAQSKKHNRVYRRK
jgi:hypothetical protein